MLDENFEVKSVIDFGLGHSFILLGHNPNVFFLLNFVVKVHICCLCTLRDMINY